MTYPREKPAPNLRDAWYCALCGDFMDMGIKEIKSSSGIRMRICAHCEYVLFHFLDCATDDIIDRILRSKSIGDIEDQYLVLNKDKIMVTIHEDKI